MDNLINNFRNVFRFLKSKKEAVALHLGTNTEAYSLRDDAVLKLLFAFVGPAVLGLLVNALYNFVDRIFVGQFVGPEGLSAVTLAFPITLFQFGFILLFGSGSGILIAKYLGEERTDKAEDALGNVIAALLITIVIFTTAGLLFYEPLLIAFGAQGTLLNLSAEYLSIIIIGFPLSFFLALEFTCRAEGNPRFPAKLILLSSLINVCLDYVFMKIFNMGISGAALATLIAQSTNAILLIRYYLSGKSLVKIVRKKINLKKHIILPILSVGFAPFIMDIAISFQNVFANSLLLKSGGTDGVAAMGIIFGINIFFMMTALGTGDGMQPIISYNFGAKRYDRTVKTVEYALKMVSIVALFGVVILELFPTSMIGIFINENENITRITTVAIQIFAISIPFYMVQIVMTRYFQALQKNKIATLLALLRPVLFVPIAYVLNNRYGLTGIWVAFVVSDSLAALISFLLVKKYSIKKLITLNTLSSDKPSYMKTRTINLGTLGIGLFIGLSLISCNSNENKDFNKAEAVAEYQVLKLAPETIVLHNEFPATIEGIENIEIRPKIEGFIEKVLVDEGEYVEKGRLLFVLNAPQYEQEVRNTEAAISSAEAEVNSAQIDVEKTRPLVEREIISKFELTSAENIVTAKKAALEQAQASLANAKTNYSYTRITAPVAGFIGTLPYKLGSLVNSSTADPLTTISNIKKVYAYFSINEKTHLEFVRKNQGTSPEERKNNPPEVSLLLPDYTLFDQKGSIQTISGQVDEETGSFNVRAVFDNPDNLLRTGNSATIRIPRTIENVLQIPQSATYEIQGNVYAYVVDSLSQAKSTKITVTPSTSGRAYIVTDGLKANDEVIIEGVNTLSSGKKIKPVPVDAADVEALQRTTENSN